MKKRLKRQKRITGFTLLELVIVVAIVALIAIAVFVLLNPKKQIYKSWDGQRKHDLATLSKTLEDWYNDNNCYPQPNKICYDTTSLTGDNTLTCNICGKHSNSPSFTPYLDKLPCDPEYSRKNYVYEIEQGTTCPTWFKIYTELGIETDPEIMNLGCQNGCGPAPAYAFNYGVSSPNVAIKTNQAAQPTSTPLPGAPTPTPTPTPIPGGPTNIPTPTAIPPFTPTPTSVPFTGDCINQSNWSSCTQYCQSIGKSCFTNPNAHSYKGYPDVNCNDYTDQGCTSGLGGCCNDWPFMYTRVVCYCN